MDAQSYPSPFRLSRPKDPFRLLVDAVKEYALFLMNAEGVLLSWNPGAERIQGHRAEEALGRSFSFMFRDEDRRGDIPARLLDQARREGLAKAEPQLTRKDGTSFLADLEVSALWNGDGTLQAFAGVLRDITASREAEERARQSQKMEAIGRLAGGIAHDFNNLLTAINGYSELGLRRASADPDLQISLVEIREAGQRAASLTRQLLAFSRKQILSLRNVDLNEVMGRMESMLRRLIGEDIQLSVRAGQDLPQIRADVSQVEQVIMNLAVNARDAMPSGGRIDMTTFRAELDEAFASQHQDAVPGSYVVLSISDSGMGMDEDVLGKIFEPFFTTKEAGKGTGLGLSTVYGIVKQTGGSIEVASRPGKGSCFRIYFPLARSGETIPEAPRPQAAAPRGRNGDMVLLVEDEEAVRNLVCKILSDHGYTCLPAENGEQALALLQSQGSGIRLLLTDVVLKGMSGRSLAERMQSQHPALRVLYMSGHADQAIAHHGMGGEALSILHKPFTVQSLLARIHSLLHH